MIKNNSDFQLCAYLLEKDGSPACFFRVAEAQPCGYFKSSRCYYRGGPFTPVRPGQTEERPAKETK